MAISTPSLLTSGSGSGSSPATASVTLTAGRLYFIGITMRRGDSTNVSAPSSVVRGAESFTIVDGTKGLQVYDNSSSSRRGLWAGYCIPGSTTTGTIVINLPFSSSRCQWAVVEVASGFDSGTPITQVAGNLDATEVAATSLTATFDSAISSGGAVVGFFGDAGAGGITPGDDYTELVEVQTAGEIDLSASYDLTPDTTFTCTFTAGEAVGAVAVEIKAAAAGTTVTPGVTSLSLATFAPQANLQINSAAPTALSLSAFAPQANIKINGASPTALSLSAFAPQANLTINGASPTALSLSTFAPTAGLGPLTCTPDVLALTLSTFAPGVSAGGNVTATPGVTALTLAAFAPQLNLTLTPSVVALALTAFSPALDFRISPGPASLVIVSFAPSVGAPITVTPGTLALVLTPLIPVIIATGVVVGALGYVSVRDESTALATLHDSRMGIALVNDELVARAVLRDR